MLNLALWKSFRWKLQSPGLLGTAVAANSSNMEILSQPCLFSSC